MIEPKPCNTAYAHGPQGVWHRHTLLVEPLYGKTPSVGVRELLQNAIDAVREHKVLCEKRGGQVDLTNSGPGRWYDTRHDLRSTLIRAEKQMSRAQDASVLEYSPCFCWVTFLTVHPELPVRRWAGMHVQGEEKPERRDHRKIKYKKDIGTTAQHWYTARWPVVVVRIQPFEKAAITLKNRCLHHSDFLRISSPPSIACEDRAQELPLSANRYGLEESASSFFRSTEIDCIYLILAILDFVIRFNRATRWRLSG